MKYDRNRSLPRKAMGTAEVRAALAKIAHQRAPAIAAATRVDTGETRGSTHVETGHHANDGRPAVRIVQTGAPVPLNWRHDRDYIVRSFGGNP